MLALPGLPLAYYMAACAGFLILCLWRGSLRFVGVPVMIVALALGVMAPRNTPRDIVQRLHAELERAVAAPDVRDRFSALSVEPRTSSPEAFRDLIDTYVKRWARVVRDNNIKPE